MAPDKTALQEILGESAKEAPLSFSQERLWFLDQFQLVSEAFNLLTMTRIDGPLDIALLERSVEAVTARHAILRTLFNVKDDVVSQKIGLKGKVSLAVVDLEMTEEPKRSAEAKRQALKLRGDPFNLAEGPHVRLALFRMSPDTFQLAVVMHSVVADTFSTQLFLRELIASYETFVNENAPEAPTLPHQFVDLARWERAAFDAADMDADLKYWLERLDGAPPALDLPTDFARPPLKSNAGARCDVQLSEELVRRIRAFVAVEDVSLRSVLLAGFMALLSRYSLADDLVTGVRTNGRANGETQSLIGPLENILPIRCSNDEGMTVSDFVRLVNSSLLEGERHPGLPFAKLVEMMHPPKDTSRTPVFQFTFALREDAPFQAAAAGLIWSAIECEPGVALYDLSLELRENGKHIQGWFEYSTDLFAQDTARRMAQHWLNILEAAVSNPEKAIVSLELLCPDERLRILVDWNNTASEFPRDHCFHELFEEQVRQTPQATAVVYEEDSLTYSQLNAKANMLAHSLQDRGVGPDTLVGIFLERSVDMLVAILGILKSGGAYVPLDPSGPEARLQLIIGDAKMPIILVHGPLRERLAGYLSPDNTDTELLVMESIREGIETNTHSASASHNLVYVIYTSGSTGVPKGTMITHRGLVNYLSWCVKSYGVHRGAGAPVHTSLSFDLTVTSLFAPLLAGRAVRFLPNDFGAESLATALKGKPNYSLVKITPSHLEILSKQLAPEDFACSTRALIIGGENLLAEHIDFWRRHAPETLLVNEYGPTETVVGCCVHTVPIHVAQSGSVPIGRPIANTRLYILDSYMHAVPIGVSGELYIGGEGVARGYLNRPEQTAAVFVADPFSDDAGSRLYKTGDVCRYLRDGTIEYLGRADDQIKLRGYRIELGEIASALRRHPAVAECAVLAHKDPAGEQRLAAYWVPDADSSTREATATQTFRDFLLARIPDYMVPSLFVSVSFLPLTSNGKLDKSKLPTPNWGEMTGTASHTPAKTETERTLAGIWAEMLGLTRVGAEDNFFELGGHSLIATRLLSRIRETFGATLPLRTLFEAPTIVELAKHIESIGEPAQAPNMPPIAPAPRDTPPPLSFAQQRLWFLAQLAPDSTAYNIAYRIRYKGPLNETALATAINYVVRRHEVLRTTFEEVDGSVVQRIAPPENQKLDVADLTGLPKTDCEAETQRIEGMEAHHVFDLSKGPLFRTKLIRLDDDEHVLCIVVHHVVFDGWSVDVLHRELASCYESALAGEPPPLPELPIQYADFSVWQHQQFDEDALARDLEFWREALAGELPVLNLATDRPRPPAQTFQGGCVNAIVSPEITESLKALARETGTTLFAVLAAAWQTLLHRYTGQEDILIGTGISGRDRAEVEPLAGFFVNTVALRTSFTDNPSFVELVIRVHATMLDIQEHQHMPFEQLVETLLPERDASRSPLFQVMFVLQNTPSSELHFSNLTSGVERLHNGGAKFDLVLDAMETGNAIDLEFEYNTALFNITTAEGSVNRFLVLLESIVANPKQNVSSLSLLPKSEQRQLIVEWNATKRVRPNVLPVHELIEHHAGVHPSAIAVQMGNYTMRYGELNARANQWARHLKKRGAGPEKIVAVCMERSPELLLAELAIWKSGAAYLPLDPTYPKARLAYMVRDSGAMLVLTQSHLADTLAFGDLIASVLIVDRERDETASESKEDTPQVIDNSQLAYVIYTSGSTGEPKGVAIENRGLQNLIGWHVDTFSVCSEDRATLIAGIAFDASVWETWPYLTVGASLHIPEDGIRSSNDSLQNWLIDEHITISFLPTPLAETILALPWPEQTSLRYLLTGGDKLHRFAPKPLPFTLVNNYGPTENTVVTTSFSAVKGYNPSEVPPIGRPISNTNVYILDKCLQPVPVGVPGELYIGGDSLARGYLNQPELTAEKFIPSPFSNEQSERLYKTCDLVRYLPDGNIEFLGRMDNQVKLRGFRIELGEIETLLTSFRSIDEAAVLLREDAPGDKRIVAYVVLNKEEILDQSDLRDFVRAKLPEYMTPSAFVVLDALPLTPNGKVDRRALPAPDRSSLELKEETVAPRTEVETVLARIWQEVLGIERLGVQDNFFNLGGHSLSAVRLVSRICDTFQVKWGVSKIFNAPTIEALAIALEDAILQELEGEDDVRV